MAALMLAEAGADVVKVEPPGGDPDRACVSFAIWNRSKRSIVIDPARDSVQLDRLLRDADVVIHDEAGLGIDLTDYPHLVSCCIRPLPPGYDAGLGDVTLPADDLLMMAATGILAEQPATNRAGPACVAFPLGSLCAAWLATIGITARLLDMRSGGPAGPIDTSLLQGALVPLTMLWRQASHHAAGLDGRIDKKMLPALFECGDGTWLHLMKNADATPLMRELLDAMGPAAMAAANAQWPAHFRYTNWGANVRAFRSRSSAEWLADLWAADIPVQPALPMGALYGDAQARVNGYVVEVDDRVHGKVLQPGFPVTMDPPGQVYGPAPAADADRAAILAQPARVRNAPPAVKAPRPLLQGVRVIDFGQYLAGPLATMILADLGADVIKVEPPTGDPMRSNESAFLGCQRGKRSLVLDLKSPGAGEVIQRLVQGASVVHHNLRLPSARRLGLDYGTLKAIRPDIVFGHVSAYGPAGDRRYWPGYDQLFQACTGWERTNGGIGNRPAWLRFGMMDHLCAMSLGYGLLLALLRRQATGEGSEVAASLLGTSMLTMSDMMMRADGSMIGHAPVVDAEQMAISPGRRLAQCTDGWIAWLGPDAAAPSSRDIEAMTVETAIAWLCARGFAAVPVRTDGWSAAFLNDPANTARGLVAAYPHPVYGELRHPGAFWSVPDGVLCHDRGPPVLGQHSAEILDELGFSANEIARLIDQHTVAFT
jgi:crotonobetainyl-CoA:carnitine CoA-transferase CaiB-like acyl-CoA transferase